MQPGLEFGEVTPNRVVEGGVAVLVFEGEIVNQSRKSSATCRRSA